MYLHSILILVSTLTMVQASCYVGTTGAYGQSMDGADAAVDRFCENDLVGYFTEGETKYRCIQLPKNKIEFWVGWTGQGGLTLKGED
ncbi:hypothetical protein T440DRAFT_363495, partial [Plenodomus tracheiphilus IPT5]